VSRCLDQPTADVCNRHTCSLESKAVSDNNIACFDVFESDALGKEPLKLEMFPGGRPPSCAMLFSSEIKRCATLKNFVLCRCKENAGAASPAPNTMIDAANLGAEIIAGIKRFIIDDQDALQEVQLFNSGMTV
jgi:hypothetical protein